MQPSPLTKFLIINSHVLIYLKHCYFFVNELAVQFIQYWVLFIQHCMLPTEMGNSFPISNVTSSPLFLISLCMSNFVANEKRSIWDSKDIACKSCELT